MGRYFRDTRGRDELKFVNYGPSWEPTLISSGTRVMVIPQFCQYGVGERWLTWRFIDDHIPPGTGKQERMGTAIQLRAIQFSALLDTANQDVIIRWAVLKTKTDRVATSHFPEMFMSPLTVGGVPQALTTHDWATTWINPASEMALPVDTATGVPFNWRQNYKLMKTGRIHMPEFQLTKVFKMNLNFRVGYRPKIQFGSTQEVGAVSPTKNEYILVMWSNKEPTFTGSDADNAILTGACLRDCRVKVSYYDA